MRLCPTVDGHATPLITSMISSVTCMAQQRCFYHKCHRCIFRGQPANWEPATAAEEHPASNGQANGVAKVLPAGRLKTRT